MFILFLQVQYIPEEKNYDPKQPFRAKWSNLPTIIEPTMAERMRLHSIIDSVEPRLALPNDPVVQALNNGEEKFWTWRLSDMMHRNIDTVEYVDKQKTASIMPP